jgi:hypothetical protein
MSTIVAQTLSNGTVSTSTANCIQGSAKAWVNFNGAAATVSAAYNVSSVTRSSTGTYVINFTNALSDANYAAVLGSRGNSTGANGVSNPMENMDSPTRSTTQLGLYNLQQSFNPFDAAVYSVAIFR